jgi:hypothetical protein
MPLVTVDRARSAAPPVTRALPPRPTAAVSCAVMASISPRPLGTTGVVERVRQLFAQLAQAAAVCTPRLRIEDGHDLPAEFARSFC